MKWKDTMAQIPRLVTFTFDDGTLDHFLHAAPVLEKYGYHGMFNVMSGYCKGNIRRTFLGYDCMVEDEVRELISRGHEIASHTVNHANIRDLYLSKRYDECVEEIVGSKYELEERFGIQVRYFCYPHNVGTPMTSRIARKAGMMPFGPMREYFGAWQFPKEAESRARFIEEHLLRPRPVVDIMFHGTLPNTGWNAYEGAEDFEFVIREIRRLEDAGLLKCVKFSEAHPWADYGLVDDVVDWAWGKVWPTLYAIKRSLHR